MSKELIRRLREFDQPRLEKVYQNVFNTDEGQLVLEDLMEQEDAGAGA